MIEVKRGLESLTTTVGIVVKEGVVLATDKRVTAGYFIAHKRGVKIWKIDEHVAATMSGAVADLQKLLDALSSLAAQYKIDTGEPIPIRSLANYASLVLFYSRPILWLVHVILGGWDPDEGPVLYTVDFFGSVTKETEFISTGSGSPIALGVLEDGYDKDMGIDDAIKLAVRAVWSAMQRDPGSGEGIDVAIVTKEGFKFVDARPYLKQVRRGVS